MRREPRAMYTAGERPRGSAVPRRGLEHVHTPVAGQAAGQSWGRSEMEGFPCCAWALTWVPESPEPYSAWPPPLAGTGSFWPV